MGSRGGKRQRRERVRGEEGERASRKKIKVHKKVEKSQNTEFFPMLRGSGVWKSKLANAAKAAGAEPSGRRRDQKLHAVVARSRFGSQYAKKI